MIPNPSVFFPLIQFNEKFMKANGNSAAKNLYEKFIPVFYYQPRSEDCE